MPYCWMGNAEAYTPQMGNSLPQTMCWGRGTSKFLKNLEVEVESYKQNFLFAAIGNAGVGWTQIHQQPPATLSME